MGRSELQKLLEEKKKVKEKFFAHYFPTQKSNIPLVMVFEHESAANKKVLFQLLEGLLILPVMTVVVSASERPDHLEGHAGKISWVTYDAQKINNWLLASDMGIIFHHDQAFLPQFFNSGVVPIGPEKSPLLQNYHPNEETGNSFTFPKIGPWEMFAAIVRALETYRFPYDWQNIIRLMLKVR